MAKIYMTVFILFFTATASAQTTVIINAAADNTIFQELTGNSNGAGINFFSGNTAPSNARRGLIRFDLAAAGIPAGAVISSASLALNMNKSVSGAAVNIAIHKLLSNWGEGASNAGSPGGQGVTAMINDATWLCSFSNGAGGCSVTWPAGGNFSGTASAATAVGPATGNYIWTSSQLTADVQGWLNNPSTNFGWAIIGDESTGSTANRFSSRESGVTSPKLSVTYAVLPVTLIFFRGSQTEKGNILTWETAQETDNYFFSVEHSSNAIDFLSIGKIPGHGTTSLAHTYSFTHDRPAAGMHYYRLVQTDINGRKNYSSVVSLHNDRKGSFLLITPNPVADKIIIKGAAGNSGNRYAVINKTGALVLSGILKNSFIDVKTLSNGEYFIRVQPAGEGVITAKFIKQ